MNNLEKLKKLNEEIEELKLQKAEVEEELLEEHKETMSLLKDKDYGAGTVELTDGKLSYKVTVAKDVKWNKDILSELWTKFLHNDKDPEKYLERTISMKETVYKKLTPKQQLMFNKARTVGLKKPSFKLNNKKDK